MHQLLTTDPQNSISPEILLLRDELRDRSMKRLGRFDLGDLDAEVCQGRQAIWCIVRRTGRGGLALRAAHLDGAECSVRKMNAERGEALRLEVESALGRHELCFTGTEAALHRLRMTTKFTPAAPIRIPYLPRDLYALDGNDDPTRPIGNVEAAQRGTTSGLVYFRFEEPGFGSVLYFQNLTALNPYFLATGTKPDGVVGGDWPELGLQLPTPETQEVGDPGVLEPGQDYVLSDAIVVLRDWAADDEQEMARQFLQMLGTAYKALDLPKIEYRDWVKRAERTLRDLETAEQARRREYGDLYLMPYPDGEYPDSMVQLSVIQALDEYGLWRGEPVPLEAELMKGVHRFYDPKVKTLRRYLPNVGEKQGKDPDAVDSWYLYHPMLNLGRLALRGNGEARDLLLKSIDYGIEAAHRFDYAWPIMYKIEDFSIITKARGDERFGQTDVGGIYAYVMLQCFELTGEERFRHAVLRNLDYLTKTWLRAESCDCDLWTQDLYGKTGPLLGAAHGFAGNVFAYFRAAHFLPKADAESVLRRAIRTLQGTAHIQDDVANWSVLPGAERFLVQWCHGAPGIITSFGRAPADEDLDDLLTKGGELIWRAGPLRKGSNLCHGTAGNGAAMLTLFSRTGDAKWLDRARRFAMHSIGQVAESRKTYGQGRYSLWTGDLGVAVYLWQCSNGISGMPSLDF